MPNEKLKYLILIGSSILILFGIFIVLRTDLTQNKAKNTPDNTPTKIERIKVFLNIFDGIKESSFSVKVDKGSSLYDVMEKLRKEDKLTYEITNYTDGESIDTINGKDIDKTKKLYWNLYIDGNKSDLKVKEVKVNKNSTYRWVYEFRN